MEEDDVSFDVVKARLLDHLGITIPRTVRILEKKPYTAYVLQVDMGPDYSWTISARYSLFHDLHTEIKRTYPGLNLPKFPSKSFGSALKPKLIQQRQADLQAYMQQLVLNKAFRTSAVLQTFLELDQNLTRLIAVSREANASELSIHEAVQQNKYNLVVDMVRQDFRALNAAQPDTQNTPLHVAILQGHDRITSFLLEQGASGSAANEQGWNVLHCAAAAGKEELVALLMGRKGTAVTALTTAKESVLHLLAGHCTASSAAMVVPALLDANVPVNAQTCTGETALHLACFLGNIAVVRALLDRGASVDLANADGESALHWAARGGKQAIVSLLIQKGADVNLAGKYGTPLEIVYQKRAERSSMRVEAAQVEQAKDDRGAHRHTIQF